MELAGLNGRGLVLVGCGNMGGALLDGWLEGGLAPASVGVIDPKPRADLAERGIAVNDGLPEDPAVMVIAVKPQMMAEVLPSLQARAGKDTLVLTVAAGTNIPTYEAAFPDSPVVRAMPNTPAAIRQGISAIVGNGKAGDAQMALAEMLMGVVGPVVRLEGESQMDAVTGLSGSGPGYVFYLIEAMTEAGVAEGLPREMAQKLATATVAGAGALAMASAEQPSVLRDRVTSPNGTTAAGLSQLMNPEDGLEPLMRRTVAAAAARGRELGK